MATTLSYALEERHSNRQAHILAEFRSSQRIAQLFEDARRQRQTMRVSREGAAQAGDGPMTRAARAYAVAACRCQLSRNKRHLREARALAAIG